jgi:steroid delta-isomerase-like uncharacterized protein
MADADRKFFERWFDEMWNKGNYDYAKNIVDENFVAHGAGGQSIKQGPDGVAALIKIWRDAFPDGVMTIDDVITEGNLSTIRMTWRGTHLGDFYGMPASGNKIEVTSTGIDRVENGKIMEGWGEVNILGLIQQINAKPEEAK